MGVDGEMLLRRLLRGRRLRRERLALAVQPDNRTVNLDGDEVSVLSFASNYERGLSVAGENMHAPECSFSPAAESPRS